MKILYFAFVISFIAIAAEAQLKKTNLPFQNKDKIAAFLTAKKEYKAINKSNLRVADVCNYDSIDYVFYKLNDINFIGLINATGEPLLAGQYFPCPQPLTISGFYFYAIKGDATDPSPINVNCSIYNATADSSVFVKLGTTLDVPLATVSVPVDTSGYASNVFHGLRKAVFSKPITVNKPFIVAITNPSSVDNVIVVTNDFSDSTAAGKPRTPDGQQEWLLSLSIRTSATGISSHNSSWYGIDGDLLVVPFVKYDLTANFSVNKTTVSVGENVVITNLSSPVLSSVFYNKAVIAGQDSFSYYWDFGDSTGGVANTRNIANKTFTKNYSKPGQYVINLIDSIYGFSQACGSSKSIVITVKEGTQSVQNAFNSNGIKIFPNPAEGDFTIAFEDHTFKDYEMVLTSITGAEVLRGKVNGSADIKISLKDHSKGMYLLKLYNEKEIIIKQVISR